MAQVIDLSQIAWTVRACGDLARVPESVRERVVRGVEARVPGCVLEDLVRAGVVGDPRVGMNEEACGWVGWVDWRYEAEFEVDARMIEEGQLDLAFERLDTIAEVALNGMVVGGAASEFVAWRWDVSARVHAGANQIAVMFASPMRHVRAEAERLGARPVNGEYPPYNMIRKCASSFEWDWGPRVPSCGITGSARLIGWSAARFEQVLCRLGDDGALHVAVRVHSPQWSAADSPLLRCTLSITNRGDGAADIEEELSLHSPGWSEYKSWFEPRVWYAARAGTPGLSELHIALWTQDGKVLDEVRHRIGVYERMDHLLGEEPYSMFVRGEGLFSLGANWIPQGLFPSERTPEKVRPLLEAARDCGMNMIRVWGGGRYEPDWFYELCDELGLMVWQDFMFACACYPEEEPVRSLVEREAREQVARLSRHPSVVLWCGGNENHWAWRSWGERGEGYRARLKEGQTWGRGYWQEMLPQVVKEVDPERAYWPDSPWSGDEAVHPNDAEKGDRHSWDANFWDAWSGGYQKMAPRFCSEFGQQSPSNWATLQEAELVPARAEEASDGSWSSGLMGSALARRQRGPGGNTRWFDASLDALFNRPCDFGQWHYAAQLLQARAVRTGIEWHRVNGRPQGVCSGVLVWQLNDAWPGLSWSLIDSAGRKKPAYYAAKHAMRPRILSVHLVDGEAAVYAVNDLDEPWRTRVAAGVVSMDGRSSSDAGSVEVEIGTRSAALVMRVGMAGVDARRTFLSVRSGDGVSAEFWWAADRELACATPTFAVRMRDAEGGYELGLAPDVVARDVVVAIDRIDAEGSCEDQVFTILPGEEKVLRVRTRLERAVFARGIRGVIGTAAGIGAG